MSLLMTELARFLFPGVSGTIASVEGTFGRASDLFWIVESP
jgi:hypothetical protein